MYKIIYENHFMIFHLYYISYTSHIENHMTLDVEI